MVDEETPTDLRTGVDLNSGQEASNMGEEARKEK